MCSICMAENPAQIQHPRGFKGCGTRYGIRGEYSAHNVLADRSDMGIIYTTADAVGQQEVDRLPKHKLTRR